MKPTDQQQKARITIALYAMERAMVWFNYKFFGDEPAFKEILLRMSLCLTRCKMLYGRENLEPTNVTSLKAVAKALDLYDDKFFKVKKVKEQEQGIYVSAYLEMASMACHDVIVSCVDYKYRPFRWLYLCSQKVIKWMYEICEDEDKVYEMGANWYFSICDKIGRR